jgi:hypothetical protein
VGGGDGHLASTLQQTLAQTDIRSDIAARSNTHDQDPHLRQPGRRPRRARELARLVNAEDGAETVARRIEQLAG